MVTVSVVSGGGGAGGGGSKNRKKNHWYRKYHILYCQLCLFAQHEKSLGQFSLVHEDIILMIYLYDCRSNTRGFGVFLFVNNSLRFYIPWHQDDPLNPYKSPKF